jgi:hypothetical protein
VLVGVDVVGDVLDLLVEQREGLRDALAVLAVDGARLGLEGRLLVIEVLEPVGLDLDDLLEVFGGEVEVVAGDVIGGVGVRVGADRGHDAVVDGTGIGLRAAEHHVLEEVGEARLAGLHFVAAPGPHDRVVGDDAGAFHRDQDDLEPVREGLPLGLIGEDILCHAGGS